MERAESARGRFRAGKEEPADIGSRGDSFDAAGCCLPLKNREASNPYDEVKDKREQHCQSVLF